MTSNHNWKVWHLPWFSRTYDIDCKVWDNFAGFGPFQWSWYSLSFWREWRGSMDGRPSMFIRNLFSFRGYKIDLHKLVRADDPKCFHTHPATAIRLILWGGYTEQIMFSSSYCISFTKKQWMYGDIGIVKPEHCHRIDWLRHQRPAYTLWFRGPKTAEVKIEGEC